jgi:S-adenosylmethionine-diacylgycerolhomoserine-N-methlytransferase
MIPDWPCAVDEMARHLAPNGSLHIVDVGDCAGLPRVAQSALYGWLAKFDVKARANLCEALAAAAECSNLDLAFTPLFRGYAQYGVFKRR